MSLLNKKKKKKKKTKKKKKKKKNRRDSHEDLCPDKKKKKKNKKKEQYKKKKTRHECDHRGSPRLLLRPRQTPADRNAMERAARGISGATIPWGEELDESRTNTEHGRGHLVSRTP